MSFPIEPEPGDQRVVSQRVVRDDTKFTSGKLAFFQYLAVAVFLFLMSGFWNLQVRNPELYSEQAERNRIKSLPV